MERLTRPSATYSSEKGIYLDPYFYYAFDNKYIAAGEGWGKCYKLNANGNTFGVIFARWDENVRRRMIPQSLFFLLLLVHCRAESKVRCTILE